MFLAPRDKWPRHPRPLARAALEEARASGWWFRPSEGHNFGRLRCIPPEQDPGHVACAVPIFSTSGPADGSETARAIRDAVRKCGHHRDDLARVLRDPESAARLAAGALAVVARLIDAATALLNNERALAEAGDIIDAALERMDDDGKIVEAETAASELERLAAIEDARARASAFQAGGGDPWPPVEGAQELVGLAVERLAAASDLLVEAMGADDEGKLAAERDRLGSVLQGLSSRLDSGR